MIHAFSHSCEWFVRLCYPWCVLVVSYLVRWIEEGKLMNEGIIVVWVGSLKCLIMRSKMSTARIVVCFLPVDTTCCNLFTPSFLLWGDILWNSETINNSNSKRSRSNNNNNNKHPSFHTCLSRFVMYLAR